MSALHSDKNIRIRMLKQCNLLELCIFLKACCTHLRSLPVLFRASATRSARSKPILAYEYNLNKIFKHFWLLYYSSKACGVCDQAHFALASG